jgi:tRNA U34 5-carboxymethylaminomethyl modifying enzyme MnmG/GidA
VKKFAPPAGKLLHNPYVVLASFIAASVLLMQAGPIADAAIVVVAWSVILIGSIVVGFRMFRSGRSGHVGYGQLALMSDRVRRWVLDERD